MRRLSTAVVAGGVVYPAGTVETLELAEMVTDPSAWSGESSTASEPAVDEPKPETTTESDDAPTEQEKAKPARKRAAKKPAED